MLEVSNENILYSQADNNLHDSLMKAADINEEFELVPLDQATLLEQVKKNGNDVAMTCDCSNDGIDQWTQQFDMHQGMLLKISLPLKIP